MYQIHTNFQGMYNFEDVTNPAFSWLYFQGSPALRKFADFVRHFLPSMLLQLIAFASVVHEHERFALQAADYHCTLLLVTFDQ